MRRVVNLNFVLYVMFAGHLVNASRCVRIRDKHSCLCKRGRRPNVEKCSAAAIRYPKARVFAVPMAHWVRISRVIAVVWIFSGAVGTRRAMAAEESNIVQHRI